MPKLVLKRKAEVLAEVHLKNAKAAYSIGSDEENDLVIPDKRVSTRHALVERHSNRYFVRDLKSAFGTFLNNEKIEEQTEIHHGDLLSVGDHTILFENPLEAIKGSSKEDAEFELKEAALSQANHSTTKQAEPVVLQEKTSVEILDSKLTASQDQNNSSKNAASGEEMAPYYFLAIYGPYSGKRFQLKYGETRIGRDSKLNDIIIRENKRGEIDPSISRRHATVSYHDQFFHVLDKRSKTRTYVNREEVPEDGEIPLHPGDEIEIVSDQKSTIFRFVAEGNWDFSPPQRAGIWWVRYKERIMRTTSTLAILVGLFFLIQGYHQRSMLKQRPDPLALEMVKWRPLGKKQFVSKSASLEAPTSAERPVAAIADFNGDGYVDIATLGANQNPMLINGKTRRLAWNLSEISANPTLSFVAADLNDNHIKDLIFVSANGRVIAVDSKLGAEIFSSPFFHQPFSGPPIVADFDADGWPDIAIAEQSGVIRIGLNRVIKMEWTTVDIGLPIKAPLATADLDGDGDFEILGGTDRGLIFIIDGSTRKIAGTVDINDELNKALGTLYVENQIRYPIGVADLNGDQIPDLVCSSAQGNIIAINGATKQRLWYAELSQDLVLSSQFPYHFALGDMNGDGLPDVIASTDQGEIKVFSGPGKNLNPEILWQYLPAKTSPPLGNLIIHDINKDNIADVIYLDGLNILRVLDGRSGKPLWGTGQPISEHTSPPFVADLGKDGILDIILVSNENKIYQYQTNSRFPKSAVIWGQSMGTQTHTLHSEFKLPGMAGALFALTFGFLVFLSGSITLFMSLQKYRRPKF